MVTFTHGLILSTKLSEFRVSDIDSDSKFDSIVGSALADPFQAFSKSRVVSTLDDNTLFVTFETLVSDVRTEASVSGFGGVFCDVDLEETTKMDSFLLRWIFAGQNVCRLGTRGFELFGGPFENESTISKVVITLGNAPMKNAVDVKHEGKKRDIVVMDDFLYGEPVGLL